MNFEKYGMSCEQFVQLILEYVEGRLPDEQLPLFHKHQGACINCETFLKSYQATIRSVGTLKEDECAEVPEALVRAVLASIRKQEG